MSLVVAFVGGTLFGAVTVGMCLWLSAKLLASHTPGHPAVAAPTTLEYDDPLPDAWGDLFDGTLPDTKEPDHEVAGNPLGLGMI